MAVEESRGDERENMVAEQLAARGIGSTRVLAALRKVPRHVFVPEDLRGQAYEDHPLRIACGQTISQPYMVAAMTELLELTSESRVLEIGTGSGYQTAILAELAREVVSIERHRALADEARGRLEQMGYPNIAVLCGDGSLGYPESAPYDAILVTAASPAVPEALKQQLALGGRLICPVGNRDLQTLMKVVRTAQGFTAEEHTQCIFVPLVGIQGWSGEF